MQLTPFYRMKQLARYVRNMSKSQNGVLGIGKTWYGSYAGVPHQRSHLGNPKVCFLEEGPGLVGFVRCQHTFTRDWFNKFWVADKKVDRIREKKQQYGVFNWSPFLRAIMKIENRWPNTHWRDDHGNDGMEYSVGATTETPATSQYVTPTSIEETKLAPLLSRSDLLITRDIEWANLMFAFEQESKYIIVDPNYPNSPVGSIVEKSNVIYRQLLRARRPFIAYITDSYGNEIFRIRRPFWWINSTIYAEVDGKEIGVVHRRWHLWRRIYDLYIGKRQFSVVENPGFWDWTFTLKDKEEKVLAEINRDWRGFGLELFTDAGQYVIRFGSTNSRSLLFQDANNPELNIGRPLSISERAVAVALAVSLDCDYFSRRRGWGMPLMIGEE